MWAVSLKWEAGIMGSASVTPNSGSPPDIRAEILVMAGRAMGLLRASRAGAGRIIDAVKAYQAEAIYRENNNDSLAVQAALISAAFELQICKTSRASEADPADVDQSTTLLLVQLAYNRSRRLWRHGSRLRDQAQRGEGVGNGSRPLDSQPSPDHAFINLFETHAQLKELLGSIYEGLDERDRGILEMSAEGHTQEEVAAQFGCHRSSVSRVLARVRDRFDAEMSEQDGL